MGGRGGGVHTAPTVLCLEFAGTVATLLGIHSRAFASCEARLLLPCCHRTVWLPAGETNKRLEDIETRALWPFKSSASNGKHSERITGTHLHLTLKQFGRVINSNLLFSFNETAQISSVWWRGWICQDEGLSLCVLATLATEEGAVSLLSSKQSSVWEVHILIFSTLSLGNKNGLIKTMTIQSRLGLVNTGTFLRGFSFCKLAGC